MRILAVLAGVIALALYPGKIASIAAATAGTQRGAAVEVCGIMEEGGVRGLRAGASSLVLP